MWYVLLTILAGGILYFMGIIVWGVGYRVYRYTKSKMWGFAASGATALCFYMLLDWAIDAPPPLPF